jgi:hypothetical protein
MAKRYMSASWGDADLGEWFGALTGRNVALTYTCSSEVCPFVNPYTYKETHNLQTVLVGLNYRFWSY